MFVSNHSYTDLQAIEALIQYPMEMFFLDLPLNIHVHAYMYFNHKKYNITESLLCSYM